jgi:hypothetical protein
VNMARISKGWVYFDEVICKLLVLDGPCACEFVRQGGGDFWQKSVGVGFINIFVLRYLPYGATQIQQYPVT